MERANDVARVSRACGRKLLRVGATDELIELIFERQPGERSELLLTFPVWGSVSVGEIDLVEVEHVFGRQYGIGPDEIEGVAV